MPKLPDFIFDSHKRYKADTNELTTWLVETAKGLGYDGLEASISSEGQLPRTGTGRLKGKARKRAPNAAVVQKSTASIRIFVKEFTKIADFIAGSQRRIKVPTVVLKLARRAIAVRKRCAEWFKHETMQDEEAISDRTHRHFIAVLEEVVHILGPLCQQDDSKSATVETSSTEATALVNRFSLLDTGEAKDDEICKNIPPVAQVSITTSMPRQMGVHYTVAEDDSDDLLALFCCFEDLRDIRTFLRETWSEYRDRKIDLITASVTTNMAFDFLRSTQEELLALHPQLDNYKKIAGVLCVAAHGVSSTEHVKEFLSLHVYILLRKMCAWIKPGEVPVYQPGEFGIYDPRQPRDLLSPGDKAREDFILLAEVLPDFVELARLGDNLPVQDELIKELQKMESDKEISLLLVFAAQVYLDIHHVLREQVDRGVKDLRSAGVDVAKSLRLRSQNSPRVSFAHLPASFEKDVENFNSFIHHWILKDYLGDKAVRLESFYLLNRHPLLCGLLQFRMQLIFQAMGLALATAWGTILCVSHLYEAGKHAGFLELDSWKDMEWIMEAHNKERMFRGRVPQNMDESFKSLCLMLGASPTLFASTSRAMKKNHSLLKPKLSPKGPSFLKENSPVSAMFRDSILHKRVAFTVEMMEDLLADVGVKPSSLQFSEPQTKLQQQWAQSHKMTPLQVLAALRAALLAEQHMIRFDYVSLHMRCIELLREIKVMLHDELVQNYGESYFENETELSWLACWILANAAQLRDGSTNNMMLMPASQVVDGFIKREGHAESAKLEKLLKRYPEYWEELRGLADGSGVPFLEVLLINLRKEVASFLPQKAVSRSAGEADQCSDVLLCSDHLAVIAHNEDADGSVRDHVYLVHATLKNGTSFFAYTYAGELPSCAFGFNSHGVAFTVNSVPPTNEEVEPGAIGRNFVCRDLLEATDVNDALNRIKGGKLSVGHNYNVMDVNMQRILTIEAASRERYFVHEIKDDPFFHANMYLHLLEVHQIPHESSIHRQKRAAELPKSTEEEMLILLGDTNDQSFPVYMHGPQLYTLHTVVFNLCNKSMTIYKGNPTFKSVLLQISMQL